VAQPILASKVMVICPHCNQPTRIKHGLAGDGRSVRLCANCGEQLNTEERKETRKK
jgi:large subunit ribosomal protein L24